MSIESRQCAARRIDDGQRHALSTILPARASAISVNIHSSSSGGSNVTIDCTISMLLLAPRHRRLLPFDMLLLLLLLLAASQSCVVIDVRVGTRPALVGEPLTTVAANAHVSV